MPSLSSACSSTSRDAIHKLKVCLAKAWQDLGLSFLEVAASTALDIANCDEGAVTFPIHTFEVFF